MLPNKKFAFFLLIAASPFALAAPATHVPFVPSTVQNPESHAGRFGLMTTVSYGRYGQKTTSTQVIDLDAYIKSGATKLVVGVAAANLAATASKACMAAGLDGTCDDPGNGNGTDNTDAGGNTGTTGSDGSYGAGRGPSS